MIRRVARSEQGMALVTALVLMSLMMMVGLSAYAYVSGQGRESGRERHRESSFNLAEAGLGGQTFVLARGWPDEENLAFPDFCTSASSTGARCPNPSVIAQSYAGRDYDSNTTWVVNVRDDGGDLPYTTKVEQDSSSFYDPRDDDLMEAVPGRDRVTVADDANDTATDAQPRWDYNGNGSMWVRAQATVQGKRRTLVALVDVDELAEPFPSNAITAGSLITSNQGSKEIVITNGAPVALRCPDRPACSDWRDGQLGPTPIILKPNDDGKAMSRTSLDRLRERAIASERYFQNCSDLPNGNPSGSLTFIENGGCTIDPGVGACCNTAESPGVLVVANGTLELGGNSVFYGVIYMANGTNLTGTVLTISGTAGVVGTVAVDGDGRVVAGSSKENLTYDPRAVDAVKAYPSGSIVPSTWREIQG